MKKIRFKGISLINFKGISRGIYEFGNGINYIIGKNGSGKTTILDGIFWVLFGKNSDDRKQFSIVPLDTKGNPKDVDVVSVTLVLDLNGEEVVLNKEYNGTTTKGSINDIEKKRISDYEEYINENLFTADVFKLYISPTYFSEQLHWKEQREMLMDFFPEPEQEKVLAHMGKHSKAFDVALDKYTVPEIMVLAEQKMKKALASKEQLQYKIQQKIEDSNTILSDKEIQNLREKKEQLDATITAYSDKLEDRIKWERELDKVADDVSDNSRLIIEYMNKFDKTEPDVTAHENVIDILKQQRKEINEKTEEKINDTCAYCGQSLPAEKVKELRRTHVEKVQALTEKKKEIDERIDNERDRIKKIKKEHETEQKQIKGKLKELKEVQKACKEKLVSVADAEVEKPEPIDTIFTEKERISALIANADKANKEKEELEKLEQQSKELSKEYENYEILKEDAERYVESSTKIVASTVNKIISGVQVELFKHQKNGEVKPDFKLSEKGVPYEDVNSTGQVEANMRLVSFLKEKTGNDLPYIIDNYERYPNLKLGSGQYLLAYAEGNTEEVIIKEEL